MDGSGKTSVSETSPATGDFSHVPIVDFGRFAAASMSERRAVGAEIAEICGRVGFFYIANHGVPAATVDLMFAESRRFFEQKLDAKRALAIAKTGRGYVGEQEENFHRDRGEQGDLKEFFNVGLEYSPDTPEVAAGRPFYGGNQWPSELPGWRENTIAYFNVMLGLGRRLMRAVALGLDLPETQFDAMLERPMSTLRMIHYPEQAARPHITGAPSCGAHTDYGCLTMLAQDAIGGLQVQTRDGQWVDAPPVPGTFVINIGDMLGFWSNGRFRSTPHRVTPTTQDRYSTALFLQPHIDTVLTPLDGSAPGADVPTAGEHYARRMASAINY